MCISQPIKEFYQPPHMLFVMITTRKLAFFPDQQFCLVQLKKDKNSLTGTNKEETYARLHLQMVRTHHKLAIYSN